MANGHGGSRKGAGRKKRASFAEMVSFEERKKFVEFILDTYMGDMRLAVWLGNQLFGQAPQALDVTSDGKELPQPLLYALDNERHEENTPPKETN